MYSFTTIEKDEFGEEIVEQVNRHFKGTPAEINFETVREKIGVQTPLEVLLELALGESAKYLVQEERNKDVERVVSQNFVQSAAINSAISLSKGLRKRGFLSITPAASEYMIRSSRFPYLPPQHHGFWQNLAIISFRNPGGMYEKEAAMLRQEIKEKFEILKLKRDDISKNLLVINPGLTVSGKAPKGIKFEIISGVTQIFPEEVLEIDLPRRVYRFGATKSKTGMPSIDDIRPYAGSGFSGYPTIEEIARKYRQGIAFRELMFQRQLSREEGLGFLCLGNYLELYIFSRDSQDASSLVYGNGASQYNRFILCRKKPLSRLIERLSWTSR